MSSINVAPVESFIYIFMHSIDSVIHVFTHSQGLVSGYASTSCVCNFICVCVRVCVTCSIALLGCGLVLFPRGLSSFTEPWQKMEAGRGVRCIKKPLPCSDLSPLPHMYTHTCTITHTHTQTRLPTPRHLTIPCRGSTTLYQTQTYSVDAHTPTQMDTHSHTIKRTLVPS